MCEVCAAREVLDQLLPVLEKVAEKYGMSEFRVLATLTGFVGDMVQQKIHSSPAEALSLAVATTRGKEASQKVREIVLGTLTQATSKFKPEPDIAPEPAPEPATKPVRKRRMYRGYRGKSA